jgi:iron-sulfur cluster repair protein YtfE (RIC family)
MARAQSGGERNAIDMLMDDHKRVQKLFKDFEKLDREDEEGVQELVEMTCMELQIHSVLEEELFYPAVRAHVEDTEMDHRLNRAEVEHEAADELIAKLQDLGPADAMYVAYFAVLGDFVRHHIREEEKEVFPAASAARGLDLTKLGEDMRHRRDELFAEIESGGETEDETEEDLDETIDVSDIPESADENDELEDEQEALNPRRTRH